MAVDDANAYFIQPGSGGTATTMAVVRQSLADGSQATLADASAACGDAAAPTTPTSIAVDATNVYWPSPCGQPTGIWSVPIAGGTPVLAYSGGTPNSIVVANGSVYWTDPSAGTVMSMGLPTGTPTTLATGQGGPTSVAVDAASAYWVDSGAGSVMKVALAGGVPVALASDVKNPQSLAIGADDVTWLDVDGVKRIPKAGGSATTLVSMEVIRRSAQLYAAEGAQGPDPCSVSGLALDGEGNVYVVVWGTWGAWGRGGFLEKADCSGSVAGSDAGADLDATPDGASSVGDAGDASSDSGADAWASCPAEDAGQEGGPDAALGLCQASVLEESPGLPPPPYFRAGAECAPVLDPASNLYWLKGYRCVEEVPLDGGAGVTTGTCTANGDPTAFAVDDTAFYYTDPDWYCGNLVESWALVKLSRADGSTTALQTIQSTGGCAHQPNASVGVAVDARAVYWAAQGGVFAVSTGGGAVVQLHAGKNPNSIAIDATNAYWTDDGTGTVMSVPLTGGNAVTIASGQVSPRRIRVDATSVYWLDPGAGTVMKAPLGGGTPTVLASCQYGLAGIGLDASYVYWSIVDASLDGAVLRAPIAGGPAVLLISQLGQLSPCPFPTSYVSDIVSDGAGKLYLTTTQGYDCARVGGPGLLWRLACTGP
jgi:hypothetical protein